MPTAVDSPIQPCLNKGKTNPEEDQDPTKHWIKFLVQDDAGKPVPNVTVQVTLPDGSIAEKTSGLDGMIEINNIAAGDCKIEADWRELTAGGAIYMK